MHATRELTGDKIVEAALGPEWELADEGKPRYEPGGKLLREASPVEWLPLGATVLYTCRVGQANRIQGIGHGCTVVISSPDSDVELFELVQTLEEVGCGGGDWNDEESEKSKTRDSTGL